MSALSIQTFQFKRSIETSSSPPPPHHLFLQEVCSIFCFLKFFISARQFKLSFILLPHHHHSHRHRHSFPPLSPQHRKRGATVDPEAARVVDFDAVFVTRAGDSAALINAKLAAGKHVLFTPGIYKLEQVALFSSRRLLGGAWVLVLGGAGAWVVS